MLSEQGVHIEDVAELIENEEFFAIEEVPSQTRHPDQMLFIVLLNDYIHCVPFVMEDNGDFFIKTVYPSRKFHKLYMKGDQ